MERNAVKFQELVSKCVAFTAERIEYVAQCDKHIAGKTRKGWNPVITLCGVEIEKFFADNGSSVDQLCWYGIDRTNTKNEIAEALDAQVIVPVAKYLAYLETHYGFMMGKDDFFDNAITAMNEYASAKVGA
jgi:hypothetical protein